MRKFLLLTATLAFSAPAFAWVPKLDATTAKNVLDGVYGRRDPVTTFQTIDLSVKDGKFVAGDAAVRAADGGDACVADWLTNPGDLTKGSRINSITASGQADQLYFQGQDARDNFKNLSVTDAMNADLTAKRLADGELRVDINVRGLPTQKARDAYQVRMKGPGDKLIAPTRRSYVNDFKQDGATWSGTLVYYFKPLDAGLGNSDKAEMLLRTEADTSCAYNITLDLGSFQ